MKFDVEGSFNQNNVKALQSDLIDLLFCYIKREEMPDEKSSNVCSLQKEILLALDLTDQYLQDRLPQKEFLNTVEFLLNLYTLLLQKVYLPEYRQYSDYPAFMTDHKGYSDEKSYLR